MRKADDRRRGPSPCVDERRPDAEWEWETSAGNSDPFAVDPFPPVMPPDWEPDPDFWRYPPRQPQPIETGDAARWQESLFKHWTDKAWGGVDYTIGQCYEVARFTVPQGHQGIIQWIETSVLFADGEGQPNFIPGFYSPLIYDILSFMAYGKTNPPCLRFYLKLESLRTGSDERRPLIVPNRAHMPGTHHPQIGEWGDTRYDWSRIGGEKRVRIYVPEAHVCRLWIEFPQVAPGAPRAAILAIAGRLAGLTQMWRDNPRANDSARSWD